MKLQIGQRLPSNVPVGVPKDPASRAKQRNAPIYVVTEKIAETPWYGLYRGKKIFRNARSDRSELDEADPQECLDVLLKTIIYSRLDSRDYVKARRDQMWFEAKTVLGCRKTNLLPESLDFFEERNTQDAFAFAKSAQFIDGEPVLVVENIVGSPLAKWSSTQRGDIKRALHVVAETLNYVNAMHSEGFLVNAVHPAAFWIDETDRVYHLATDCISSDSKTAHLAPERFPYGFGAPEVYDPTAAVDHRSDLYGWAALAYFLITGHSPTKIAGDQGARFATFQSAHRSQLATALHQLRQKDVAILASSLGIAGKRFVHNFPEGLVHAVFCCLDVRREARPASVEVLRGWCERAPPPAVSAAIGIRSRTRHTSIIVATNGLDTRLALVIRRGKDKPPKDPDDGALVYDGPLCGQVRDADSVGGNGSPSNLQYSVFCRDTDEGTSTYSCAAVARIVDVAQPQQILQLCEESEGNDDNPADLIGYRNIPPSVELLANHEAAAEIACEMLQAQKPLIRRWGVTILEQACLHAPNTYAIKTLKECGLRNSVFDIRMAAASALLLSEPSAEPRLVIEIASVLGGEAIDDRIRAVRSLEKVGLKPESVQRAINSIESDRPVNCVECHKSVKAKEVDEHLRSVHGYVEVDSQLVPLGMALRQLWQRLLLKFDQKAGAQLSFLLVERHKGRPIEHLKSALLSQLESSWLPSVVPLSSKERAQCIANLAPCLRSSQTMADASFQLLSDENESLRQLGKAIETPLVAKSLADDAGSLEYFRRQVDSLCAVGAIDEKIAMCHALVRLGASAAVAGQCIDDLEQEREVTCSICGTLLPRRLLPKHERMNHDRYVFEGERMGWEELAQRLARRLIFDDPTLDDARLCADVVKERTGASAMPQRVAQALATSLGELSDNSACLDRLENVAGIIGQLQESAGIARELLRSPEGRPVELGLLILPFPHDSSIPDLDQLVVESLARNDLDLNVRTQVVTKILRQRMNGSLGDNALRAFIKPEPDKLAAIDRLQSLIPSVGRLSVIASLCEELEGRLRVQCPVCHEVMTGSEMRLHAPSAHRKIWEGRRFRNPWDVAEEYLEQCSADHNHDRLAAAERLALLAGGESAVRTFMRMAVQRGVGNNRYLPVLLREAAEQHSSLCRQCYLPINSPRAVAVGSVSIGDSGDLQSDFATIAKRRSLLLVECNIQVKNALWKGDQPTGYVPKNTVLALIAGFGGTALVGMLILLLMHVPGALVVIEVLVGAGVVFAAGVGLLYHPRHHSTLNIAWEHIVIPMLKTKPSSNFLAFLMGLVRLSEKSAEPRRERQVAEAAVRCLSLFHEGLVTHSYPAALHRLLLIDILRNDKSGRRAVQLISDLIHRWRDRQIPVEFLDLATADGALIDRLSPAQQRLLRWRLLGECNDIGLTPTESLSIGESSKTFQHLLSQPESTLPTAVALAYATHQVDKKVIANTNAISVFHFAHDSNDRAFSSNSDIVLVSSDGQFVVRPSGLTFRDIHITK